MASSSPTSSSWSPENHLLTKPTRVRALRNIAHEGGDDDDYVSPWRDASRSRVRSVEALRAICRKYSIPDGFTPLLAGDRSARAPPPPGSVCVYIDALEAGMRLPLHPFFGVVLDHFGIAPAQLAPNGWRALAGFVVLSHFAGTPPSLPVFRHFFSLVAFPHKLYSLRGKDATGAGLLFRPTKAKNAGWKEEFFFMSSPAASPWQCPVQWGRPFRSATSDPSLTGPEKAVAASLLRARGGCPIDLTAYLRDSNLAAAKIIGALSPPPPTPQGELLKRAAHAPAEESTVKSEPDCVAPSPSAPSSSRKEKKRKLPEHHANGESSASGYLSFPPGFYPHLRKARTTTTTTSTHGKQCHGGEEGDRSGWKAARQLLQCIVTPERQREHAASRPADVVASSYVSLLQTANEVAFSLGYALELEERLRDADELRAELRKVKAELADTKAKAAAVRESRRPRAR
ncbi:hypothetical protein VPH35_068748 [Triticum aestivum]|uniref:uncharacterized protein n=1 Tax=Triticum aestivum TaxID=4565 RepID=UPI001D00E7BD|nr:uncharacterized protein LOC123082883 [Triticum aestivum]